MARRFLATPSVTPRQGSINLSPHQVDAAARILSILARWGGAVLADVTGLGKTYVAIAVARMKLPALIIAPAALRQMWAESLGRTAMAATFASYEEFSRGARRAFDRPRLVILDEAHHARNPRARRYAAIADVAWGADVLLLTATPIHNRTRDLRALIALVLGARADRLPEKDLLQMIVRREAADVGTDHQLPRIEPMEWIGVSNDPQTLRAIRELPPAVPPADGSTAHALLLLGLIRAWTSSEAALRAALRRRLRRSLSLEAALESGRMPDRRELNAWPTVDDAIQLGFPEFFAAAEGSVDLARIKASIAEHVEGVRSLLASLDRNRGRSDEDRIRALGALRTRHGSTPVVAFTQFADTALSTFRQSVGRGGVALVTGEGAHVASGRVPVEDIVRGFDESADLGRAMPLDFLIATDVLSEGLSLRRARALVHLDLPWTVARLEQRVGRLRRPGSPHRSISVYAIGPPAESRELLTVVRALQRKTRVSASFPGEAQVVNSLPFSAARLGRVTMAMNRRDAPAASEQLRRILISWADGRVDPNTQETPGEVALALVERCGAFTLVAITETGVTESPRELLRAVTGLASAATKDGDGLGRIMGAIDQWLEAERGRELAGTSSDAASPAHAEMLRVLQARFARATRTERVFLAPQIERCRQLVSASRGAGAELALHRLAARGSSLDIGDLLTVLEARLPVAMTPGEARVVAVLQSTDDGLTAWLSEPPDARIL